MHIPTTRALALAPFLALAACGGEGYTDSPNRAPIAAAGADMNAAGRSTVELDAGGSSDADGDVLTYTWTQVSGPAVAILPSQEQPHLATFTAPASPCGSTLVFGLTVTDGEYEAADTVEIHVQDDSAPLAAIADNGILGKAQSIAVVFDTAVAPESLRLDGNVAAEAAVTWCDDRSLVLSPAAPDGEWRSGAGRMLAIDAADAGGNPFATLDGEWLVKLVFSNFQSADVVIGESSMTSSDHGTSAATATTMLFGRVAAIDGRLYMADYSGNRVLGFNAVPTENGTPADFVLGQFDFVSDYPGTSQTRLRSPEGVSGHGGKLVVTDRDNHRIAIFDPAPANGPGAISAVVGQPEFFTGTPACSPAGLSHPEDSFVTPDGKLLVADWLNNRVLAWNTIPIENGAAADLVLGQQDFAHCAPNDQDNDGEYDGVTARTLFRPTGVWSDGNRLIVLDSDNFRVLVWNSWPTENAQAADIVLAQPDMQTRTGPTDASATTLGHPYMGVASNGEQIFVADAGFNRVLGWNSWPTANNQPADVVLGQANMSLETPVNDDGDDSTDEFWPSARTLWEPQGLYIHNDQLLVTDGMYGRVLIFNSQ